MKNILKNILFYAVICCSGMATASYAQTLPNNGQITRQNDIKQLSSLWQAYQDTLVTMNQALNGIKNETDENQKNARIAIYTKKLEDTKNALNRLVLTQVAANQLRQQILEHATKYQNVYKLSAVSKPTENQLNMFERLNVQTSMLYSQMQITAKTIIH